MSSKVAIIGVVVLMASCSLSLSSSLGGGFYYSSNTSSETTSTKSEPTSTTPPAPSTPTPTSAPTGGFVGGSAACNLDCPTVLPLTQNYYNTRGQWAGVYTMNPVRSNKVGNNQCDVLYNYTPVGQSASTGQDKRRFTLDSGSNCNWSVSGMGDYQSGSTV